MRRPDPLLLLSALVSFAGILLIPLEPFTTNELTDLVSRKQGITILAIGTILSLPFAFVMPRVKAGIMGPWWRVPSTTYLLPRWVLRLWFGCQLGTIAGFLVLSIRDDVRLLGIAASLMLTGGALYLGAWRRLQRQLNTEFALPFWPLR